MDWPGPIYRVAPRMLLKRLRQQRSEICEQLELGCEELKEVNLKLCSFRNCDLCLNRDSFSLSTYSTFNVIPNWLSHRNVSSHKSGAPW